MPKTKRGEAREWLDRHSSYQGDACLVWPYATSNDGYPQIKKDGQMVGAHVEMCRLRHGDRPSPTHVAAHSCNKGKYGCVNPNHLRWATPAENKSDELVHGTRVRGSAQWKAKLTERDVVNILLDGTSSCTALAKTYNVSVHTISDIRRRDTWAWVSF